jgi:serine phosphatase RsbU (regulator of sigma subunit)
MVLNEYGEVTLANAGHLSPYLNGQEILLTGGLPLGIVRDVEYEQCSFVLPPAARLTLLSDGVVEARSRDGQLFGFERTSQASQLPAADIAAKAHAHGQGDDITIITLDWHATVQKLALA